METWYTLDVNSTLECLAKKYIEVTPIFLRHSIDFCARGAETLAEVCRRDGLDLKRVLIEMETEIEGGIAGSPNLSSLSPAMVVDHLIKNHHTTQRLDLAGVVVVARRVERIHHGQSFCPLGLAELLERTRDQAVEHIDRREQVLYPACLAETLAPATSGSGVPVWLVALRSAQDADRAAFEHIRTFTGNFSVPREACLDWRALNLMLKNLDADLFWQGDLERKYLFPRAWTG